MNSKVMLAALTGLAFLAGGTVVGLAWLVTSLLTPGASRYVPPASGGKIRVNYSVQWGNETGGGSVEDVEAIEFYPHYIVVREKKRSAGRVFFPEHTRILGWEPSE